MTRGWLTVDQHAAPPGPDAVSASLASLSYRPLEITADPVLAVVEALRRRRQGGCLVGRFRVVEDDGGVLRWFASRNRLRDYGFFRHFLTSAAVHLALPDLGAALGTGEPLSIQPEERSSDLAGQIARCLVGGYGSYNGPPGEPLRLGTAFSEAILGDRPDEFRLFRSWDAWAPWFGAVVFDCTFLLIDCRNKEVWLLCVTDNSYGQFDGDDSGRL